MMSDDEETHSRYFLEQERQSGDACAAKPKIADWRNGPAQLWYDMLNVSESGEGFDYGFKLKEAPQEQNKNTDVPDESFLMVAQNTWEDDIIWDDSVETKEKVMKNINDKISAAGWLPSTNTRTAQVFSQSNKTYTPSFSSNKRTNSVQCSSISKPTSAKLSFEDNSDDNTWYSIFPVENEELVYNTWEDEIIWDADAVSQIPKPKILTLDPNDENIILGIPDDVDPQKQQTGNSIPGKSKVTHPHIKKSKLLLGKAGVINMLNRDTSPPPSKSPNHDPFNISNDSYYLPRSSETSLKLKVCGANLIQHSTPVVELKQPFVQTQIGLIRLKNPHRPSLKRFSHGAIATSEPHPVMSLTKYIKKKAKMREQERIASGGGDMFFMRSPEDLTGRDGELILIEFCEEHPPLMNQVGMCSRVKNYYKRKANKDESPTQYRYGETAYTHTSPFLGVLAPGKSMQVIENNMYRAPIYEHKIPETDFLIIRTRHQYFIREVDALFTAGQLCPLHEVPGPNSKQANNFVRDFLLVFIYRLFWQSKDTPKRIRMDDVKNSFPSHSESSIRKRLKQCADFKRTGSCSNWWVLKPDFRLPPEEEIRAIVSPEQYCAYFSMLAAEQRLKDAGYGEKFLFTPEDDDEDLQLKMDDEIKVAPWNTTRAYIQAMKGKCLLQLTDSADPTGCGEGFSYIRMPIKPVTKQAKEQQDTPQKRMVTGTDADLRRLSLEKAKDLLRRFGVPENEIKKLTRWEVIDVVRTLSTEKAKAGEKSMTKFSRGNRFSAAEYQERYKEECQRIFDIQNRVLSSAEVLSTDEAESSQEEDNFDIEKMAKNIENMLANKKTTTQMSLEREEQERWELCRLMLSDNTDPKPKHKKVEEPDYSNQASECLLSSIENNENIVSRMYHTKGRILKIYRTFRDTEGKEYTRTEVVRKQAVIDAYVKVRTTKNEHLIKQLTVKDTTQRDEIRREKRRIQDQLRRKRQNQEKAHTSFEGNHTSPTSTSKCQVSAGSQTVKRLQEQLRPQHDKVQAVPHTSPRKPRPVKLKPDLKVKCGACGATGHMRTNRACPQYALNAPPPPIKVALTVEQESEISKQLNENTESLINVDGTKVKISGKLIKHAEDIKRRSLQLTFPKEALVRKRRKRDINHLDYLKKHQKPANRRRTDPEVELSSALEWILNEMRALPDVQPFLFPVNAKSVPDYYNIVSRPMDLQTMRENLREKKYQTRQDFLADINKIVENSTLYNGAKSQLTLAAKNMLEVCVSRLSENEEKLMKLEKMINPLLDDDDQVALSFILTTIMNKLKVTSESWPFMKPVSKKAFKDYYDVVKRPMDLETIGNNIQVHKYHSRKDFLSDVKLILDNCILYNGARSSYSVKAEILLNTAQNCLEEYDEHLAILEQNIKLVQEKAEIEASTSSWYFMDDDRNQEMLDSTSYLQSQLDSSQKCCWYMDAELHDPVKAEILADDLHCSSEDEEADDDMMEEVKDNELQSLTYGQQCDPIPSATTFDAASQLEGYSYYSHQGLELSPTCEKYETVTIKAGLESRSLFSKDEMQDFSQYQITCDMSHQSLDGIDNNFDIIAFEAEKERFMNIPEEVMSSYTIPAGEDHDPESLWF